VHNNIDHTDNSDKDLTDSTRLRGMSTF